MLYAGPLWFLLSSIIIAFLDSVFLTRTILEEPECAPDPDEETPMTNQPVICAKFSKSKIMTDIKMAIAWCRPPNQVSESDEVVG